MNEPNYEDWLTIELAQHLVEHEVYETVEEALEFDRCDLIKDCKNL